MKVEFEKFGILDSDVFFLHLVYNLASSGFYSFEKIFLTITENSWHGQLEYCYD